MSKYLITPSLINAYQYYIKDEWKSPAESRADFLKTLRREKTPTTESQQKGLDFENSIKNWIDEGKGFHILEDEDDGFFNPDSIICELAEIVKGGLWQQSVKKDLQVGNQDFLLYGRTDVIKRDTIFDIKFTSNYEIGKFQDSSQHLIYLYCTDLPKFAYLASDGKDWWQEDYFNHGNIENEIKSKISDFIGCLENDKEAKELFYSRWVSK